MKMLLQSNNWDCLPTSFAMVTDSLPIDIYTYIGHDGSEILWPKLDEPYNRRSFHIEELIDYCLALFYNPVMITREPSYHPNRDFNPDEIGNDMHLTDACFPYGPSAQAEERFLNYLLNWDAVLLGETPSGKRHAVAWSKNEQKILDPEGFKRPLEEFNAEVAYLIL